jgi:hypothetical protein
VAAHERRVNRTVYKLLKGYLLRSVWLYAFLGLAQFLLTGVYWLRGWGRAPIAGMALGLWGAIAALNANSLVWRSLPLKSRDASVFRWWAMVGAPGLYLTFLTGLIWVSQRSSGFPTPAPDVVLEGLFANWAVLGAVAVLFTSPLFYAVGAPSAKAVATATFATVLLCYGVPVGSGARPYSIGFITVGLVLLIISAARGYSGRHWRWPDIAGRSSAPAKRPRAAPSAYRYGMWTVLLPLFQRTAIVAVLTTVLVTVLRFVFPFPRAGAALFWIFFIGISTAGFQLTLQYRSALQPLRCLPLSTEQLAVRLLILGALPGIATLGLTFLINRALLAVDIDFGAFATIALFIIGLQALPLRHPNARIQATFLGRWSPLFLRIFWTAYIALMAANFTGAFAAFWWFRWGLIAGGAALCFSGYFILVYHLRVGMRPSSNENLFSAG